MFFKKLEQKQYEARAYRKGYEEAEAFYLKELASQRQQFTRTMADSSDRIEIDAKKRFNEIVKRITLKHDKEINRKKQEIYILEEQIRDDKKAWKIYKNFIPQLLKIAHPLKLYSESKLNEAGKEFSQLEQWQFQLELLEKKIDKISPQIEILLEETKSEEKI